MWIRFFFFSDKPSLLAMVGEDGNVYFRTLDVAKLLGYSCISSFAKRYSTHKSNQLVPEKFRSPYFTKHPNVINFQDAIRVVRKTLPRHAIPFGEDRVREWIHLWEFGYVSRSFVPAVLPFSHYSACVVTVTRVPTTQQGNQTLREWLSVVVNKTLKMFKEEEMEVKKENEYNVGTSSEQRQEIFEDPKAQMSVETNYESRVLEMKYDLLPANNIPDEIHLIVGDINYTFIR